MLCSTFHSEIRTFMVVRGFEISLQRYYIFRRFVGQVRPIITGGRIFSPDPSGLYLPFNEPLMGFNGDLGGVRRSYDLPHAFFGDAVFGGNLGVDKHGRHSGAQ